MQTSATKIALFRLWLAGMLAFWVMSVVMAGPEPPSLEADGPALLGAVPGKQHDVSGFVANRLCAECHQEAYRKWSGSHHDWAMRPAEEKTVLGNFANASITHFGVTSRFFKKDGKFFVNTEGPDGKLTDYEIQYTFGVYPLQQYLIQFPGGRLQSLTIAWDSRPKSQGGQRWFHLYPNERIDPDDPLHWTGRYQNWNSQCAECHSTNLQKNYDPETDTYHTTWDVINVSCQSCHGPGADHLRWAKAKRKGQIYKDSANQGLVVDFKTTGSRYQVDACAPCHARRHPVSVENASGRPLLDDFMPEVLREDLYHADGQILDEVYVYGSFLQSKMYHAGVRCTNCHDPHSLQLKASGNAVCVQCHQEKPNPDFPTLTAKTYNSPKHHFHPMDSAGARCVNCHMPAKQYMVVDPRRDHSFRVPRPDLSVKLGTPNACTGCHTKKSAQWAADTVAKWYGSERRQQPHYGEVIAAGRQGNPQAEAKLVALAENPEQPAIVRATALELLQGYGLDGLKAITAAIQDKDPLIRTVAVGGLERLPPEQKLALAAPLLKDPLRAVRTEAARVLSAVPAELFTAEQRSAFQAALTEYRETQLATADRPAGRLNLGVLYTNQGQLEQAEKSYQTAIRMDPYFLPARVNLANLYNATGRNQDAEQELRDAIARAPEQGELHYSLGLLLAEENRLNESAKALGKAARLLPERPRVHYNYGLALQQLGRLKEAESALHKADQLNRNDPDVLQALALFYAQQRQWERAYPYAERLVQLYPTAPGPQQLLRELQRLKQYNDAPP